MQAVYSAASKSVAALAIVRRDPSGGETVEGSGSGVVWDTYGHILTNYHCIGGVVSDKSASKVGPGLPVWGHDFLLFLRIADWIVQ